MNERDLDVAIDVDPDTLIGLNEARWKQREDLYFQLLDKKHYEFASPTCQWKYPFINKIQSAKFEFNIKQTLTFPSRNMTSRRCAYLYD